MQLMYFNLPPRPLSSSVVNCGPLSCLPPSPGGWQALQSPLFKPGFNEGPGAWRQVSILCGEQGRAMQGQAPRCAQHGGAKGAPSLTLLSLSSSEERERGGGGRWVQSAGL